MWFIISYNLGLIPLLIYVSFLAFKIHTFDTLTEFTLSIYNFRSIFVSRWRFFFKIFLIKIVIPLFHSSISLFPNVRGENVSQMNNQRSLFSHRTKISTLNIESMFSNFRVYTFSSYRPSSSISASAIPRIFYPGMRIISQLIRSKSHRDRVLVHAPCWSSTRVYTAA